MTNQHPGVLNFARVQRTGNSVVECLLGELASLVWGVEDLVVEHREVEGKTKTDGMRGSEIGGRNLSGSLVGLKRLVGRSLALIAEGKLGKITVVIALPVDDR